MASTQLVVNLIGNASSLKQAFATAGQDAQGFGGRLEQAGAKVAGVGNAMSLGVTLPLIALGTQMVSLASDVEETSSKVDVVFGQVADSIHEFAETAAQDLGLSAQEAEAAAAQYGNLFTAMGLGQQPAAQMSMDLVRLASDLASFNNADPTQVLQALQSGLVGQVEPLRAFGVNLSAARIEAEALNLGLIEQGEVMTDAAKAQAAMSIIMADTTVAQGDFARTSESAANQQRILAAEMKDAGAQLGASLLPILQTGIDIVSGLVGWFDDLGPAMQRLVVTSGILLAALGPLLSVFGNITRVVGNVISAWPTLVAAFTNPYVLTAGALFAGIALTVGIFASKAADAARRADELGEAMADGTPKAEAFGEAVFAWLDELDAAEVETLNNALTDMGTNYSELVGAVANGTMSLADFNTQMSAAIAQHSISNTVGDETITLLNDEALALRNLQTEVNLTAAAAEEAERAQRAHSLAMGEATSLGEAMRSRMGEVAGAETALATETEAATGAISRQADTMRAQIDPAFAYLDALARMRDANADLAAVQVDVDATADDLAAAQLGVVSAYAGVEDAAVELRNNPAALEAFRNTTEAAGIATGSIDTFAGALGGAFDRGDMSGLRARLTGLSDHLAGVTRDVDALGSAFGRLPATVNTNINVSMSGSGASFLDGRGAGI